MQDDFPASREATAAPSVSLAPVYGWMSAGLLVSTAAAFITLSTPALLQAVFGSRFGFLALILVELGLVVYLSAKVMTLSPAAAKGIFLGYSALNGVTLSVVLLAYTATSVGQVFFVTAGMFGAMSAWGYATKRDLTGFGSFLFMGLIGIVLASVVNLFLKNEAVYWVTSCIGVIVFAGLAAYDTQKIRTILLSTGEDRRENAAVLGALTLYLDFVNLFLMLLRLFGRRR